MEVITLLDISLCSDGIWAGTSDEEDFDGFTHEEVHLGSRVRKFIKRSDRER